LVRLAAEVWVFAYPLVVMDVMKDVATAKTGVNTFVHTRNLADASGNDSANGTVDPNPDVVFSSAWLDLGKEPVVLTVPDMHGRYYVVALTDGWANVFSSIGKRTIGSGKQEYAIVGPHWKGTLPKDISAIKSPTDMVWVLGRIDAHGKADVAAAAKLQDQFKLATLGQRTGRAGKAGTTAAPGRDIDTKTKPSEQVARMDARSFFTRFAQLLPGNPLRPEDQAVVAKIQKLGIVEGQPLTADKLDVASA